jgi:small-conductance mechanosensitive channel
VNTYIYFLSYQVCVLTCKFSKLASWFQNDILSQIIDMCARNSYIFFGCVIYKIYINVMCICLCICLLKVLLANAWHHRSDALCSFVALLGIGGASLGLRLLDPIAAVLVSVLLAANVFTHIYTHTLV